MKRRVVSGAINREPW